METIKSFVLKGTFDTIARKGNPSFSWGGQTYLFNASVSDFERPNVEAGGFEIAKKLTATVPKYYVDDEGNTTPIFTNGYPSSQQEITYTMDGSLFRILTVSMDDIDATFSIFCVSPWRGL